MADTLTGTVRILLSLVHTNDLDLSDPVDNFNIDNIVTFTSGTGANAANLLFHDQRTLSNTTEDFDLVGAAANIDGFGTVFAPATIKLLYIKNNGTTTVLNVGGAAATQWAAPFGAVNDIVNIRPGGTLTLTAPGSTGLVCAAGSTDLLKINRTGADGTDDTYDIILIGATA